MERKPKGWSWFRWIRFHYRLNKRGVLLHRFTNKGKRYLVVSRTNWQGIKWLKYFEVVQEVDKLYKSLGFPENEIVTLDTNKYDHIEGN